MTVAVDELPELDPFSPEFQADPLAVIEKLRATSPVARSMRGVEFLTYDGCAAALHDRTLEAGIPHVMKMMGLDPSDMAGPGRNLLISEGETHQALRAVVSRWFTPGRVRMLRDDVMALVRQLVAPITEAGRGEFRAHVARRIPGPVFCWMIGAPEERADELFELSETLLLAFGGDPAHADAITECSVHMRDFVEELVASKRARPGDDLMSIMLEAADAGHLTLDDVHSLAFEMLTASTDNTANTASLCVNLLAERPDQWQLLRETDGIIPGAIEECMRFDPTVREAMQYSPSGTVLLDVEVPPASITWLSILGAHYDPTVYPDPHRFDVTRQHSRPQLNFGVGRHFCLGANLARMELEALFTVLTEEWATIALDGPADIDRTFGAKARSVPLVVTPPS